MKDKDQSEWKVIFQAIGHPAIILDPYHKVLAANNASSRLTGRAAHEIVGKQCYEIFHGEGIAVPPEGCPMEKLLQSGQVETVDMEMESIGGHFLVSCTPVFDDQGKLQKIFHIATDITERKRSEESVRETLNLLQNVIDSSQDLIFVKDLELRSLLCNKAYAQAVGKQPSDMHGKTDIENGWLPELVKGDRTRGIRGFEQDDMDALGGKVVHNPNDPANIGGIIRVFDTIKLPLRNLLGNVIGVLGIARDVTDRNRTEAEHISNLSFMNNLERISQVMHQVDTIDNLMTAVLETALSIFESDRIWLIYPCDPDSSSWQVRMEITRPEYPGALAMGTEFPMTDEVRKAFMEILDSSSPIISDSQSGRPLPQVAMQFSVQSQIQTAVYPKTGRPWVFGMHQCSYRRVWNEDDVRLFTEITQRLGDSLSSMLFLQELKQSEARYRLLHETMTDAFVQVTMTGEIVSFNRSWLDMLGYSEAEAYRFRFTDITPAKWHAFEQTVIETQVLTKGFSEIYQKEYIRKDGTVFPVELRTYLLRDDHGQPAAMWAIVRDITERRNAEIALRYSEEKYRSLFEESRDVIFISTSDGRFIDVNPAGVALFGYPSKEALIGTKILSTCALPDDRALFLSLLERYGYVTNFETYLLRSDGQGIYVSITASIVREGTGKISEIHGIIRDITDHMKLEEQLRQSQKMESIGTLAGGVAHDFNNILTAIIGYGSMTLMKMAKDDPLRIDIDQILEAANRASHLTRDLLLFSRKQSVDRKPVDLNEGIQKLSKFLARVIGEDIAFRTSLSGGLLMVLADEHQIGQVLMNLASNARDAMQKGGNFTITTEQVILDKEFTTKSGLRNPGRYALIAVSDTGHGMDEDTRQRIFEPFYTTKEVGKGTGLGLAVAYGIIKQHEGYIGVYSEPGEGTTFRIYLPVIESDADEGIAAVTEEKSVGGNETILLAEDNESVRKMTESLLREFGYTVITAVDGEDAVVKFREHAEKIQSLLFDLIMPRKSGKEAYDEIRKIRPDIKVIFVSGYSPDIVQGKASLGDDATIAFNPDCPLEMRWEYSGQIKSP